MNNDTKLLLEVDNVQEALKIAAQKFGVKESYLETKTISEAKRGFLGFFSRKMKVEVSLVKKSEPETKPETQTTNFTQQRREHRQQNSRRDSRYKRREHASEQRDNFAAENANAIPNESVNISEAGANSESENATRSITPTPLIERGIEFLDSVLQLMGFNSKAEFRDGNLIELVGEDASDYIVGHYGDALKALEYLVNLALRDPKKEPRIRLDSCGYRERRIKTLERLAEATARQVIRFGRPVRLEPMASWERWIIHTTLKNREEVSTESIGEPPLRKVVIMPKFEATRSSSGGRFYSGNRDRDRDRDRGRFSRNNNRRNNFNRNRNRNRDRDRDRDRDISKQTQSQEQE